MLERIRIVLVEPAGAANVGAAARAMANMGLQSLALVSPGCGTGDPDARNYAAHAGQVLDAARVVPDLEAALSGCIRTYGTTARGGLYRNQSRLTIDAAAAEAVERLAEGEVAFVFGPERTGLENDHLLKLDRLVHIPADENYPVLNLAAAVMVVCYELRRAAAAAGAPVQAVSQREGGRPIRPGSSPATDERKARMYDMLFDALERVGFLYGQNPEHLKYALRHVLGRAGLTIDECDIVTGMARQIRWYVDHHPRRNRNPPAKQPGNPNTGCNEPER